MHVPSSSIRLVGVKSPIQLSSAFSVCCTPAMCMVGEYLGSISAEVGKMWHCQGCTFCLSLLDS